MSKLSEYCKKKNLKEMDGDYLILYRICLGILPFLLLAVIFFWVFGNKITDGMTECSFRKITGLYCIGCGGTRAFNYFVRGHIFKSFYYHPFVPYAFFAYFFFVINSFLYRHNLKCFKKLNPLILIYVGLGILFIQFIVKDVLILACGIYILD